MFILLLMRSIVFSGLEFQVQVHEGTSCRQRIQQKQMIAGRTAASSFLLLVRLPLLTKLHV